MESFTKEMIAICCCIFGVILALMCAIGGFNYVDTEQRLRCYTANQHRSTLDVLTLCKGVK